MNLVAGATGTLGTEICRQLLGQGKPVRALVRATSDPEKVAALRQLGAELVEGDLKHRPSLDEALRGVQAVITTVATTLSRQPDDSIQRTDLEGQKDLVDAAKSAGVSHFVYTSVGGALPADGVFIAARRAVEEHVKESGMTYTVLRPGSFMEIWLSPHPLIAFPYPNARAKVFGTGGGKLSWISLADVARYAVQSLENPAARNAVIELGADWLSHLEVTTVFEEVGGKPFEIEQVPEQAIREQLGMPDEYVQTFAQLLLAMAEGEHHFAADPALLNRFPIELVTVKAYAQRALAQAPA